MIFDQMRNKLEHFLNDHEQFPILSEHFFAIFGAGNTTALNQNGFARLGIIPDCYIDNNPQRIGSFIQNVPVVSFDQYLTAMKSAAKKPFILICSANPEMINQIKKQLETHSLPHMTADAYIFYKNAGQLLKTYDLLGDEVSKNVFSELVMRRIEGMMLPTNIVTPNQYFCIPPFSDESANEVFVDVGAFVGDSIEQYLWTKMGIFYRIYAFEPEERNYAAMCCRNKRLKAEWAIADDKIITEEAAIGSESTIISISANNSDTASLGARVIEQTPQAAKAIPMYSLDDYFSTINISFLKADIESYEYNMLLGAKKVVQRDHPKLAICIYHGAADLFDIPLLINQYDESYHFIIRQHRTQGYSDTVLYAY